LLEIVTVFVPLVESARTPDAFAMVRQIGADNKGLPMHNTQIAAIIFTLLVALADQSFAGCPELRGRWEGTCDDLQAIQMDLNFTDCYLLSVNGERFLVDGAETAHQSVSGGSWTITRSATVSSTFREFEIDRTETSIVFRKEGARIETRSTLKKLSFFGNRLSTREIFYSRDPNRSLEKTSSCELTKS